MFTRTGELDNIKDLRVYSEMFPTRPENIYRACLSGIRRQRYWEKSDPTNFEIYYHFSFYILSFLFLTSFICFQY